MLAATNTDINTGQMVMTNTGQSVNKLLAYVGGVTLVPDFWQFIVCTEVS